MSKKPIYHWSVTVNQYIKTKWIEIITLHDIEYTAKAAYDAVSSILEHVEDGSILMNNQESPPTGAALVSILHGPIKCETKIETIYRDVDPRTLMSV